MAVADHAEGKLRTSLASHAAAISPNDRIDVVIELLPVDVPELPTRRERVGAIKSAFERESGAVRRAIVDAGGIVTGEAWLNQTVRAELPTHALLAVAAQHGVVSMDLPRQLTADDALTAE